MQSSAQGAAAVDFCLMCLSQVRKSTSSTSFNQFSRCSWCSSNYDFIHSIVLKGFETCFIHAIIESISYSVSYHPFTCSFSLYSHAHPGHIGFLMDRVGPRANISTAFYCHFYLQQEGSLEYCFNEVILGDISQQIRDFKGFFPRDLGN